MECRKLPLSAHPFAREVKSAISEQPPLKYNLARSLGNGAHGEVSRRVKCYTSDDNSSTANPEHSISGSINKTFRCNQKINLLCSWLPSPSTIFHPPLCIQSSDRVREATGAAGGRETRRQLVTAHNSQFRSQYIIIIMRGDEKKNLISPALKC
jgi:hypothetical protein